MKKILNVPIIIHKAEPQPSDYGGRRLAMQIELKGEMRLAWSNSKFLLDAIAKVPPGDLGYRFRATIVEENDCYKFI